jgi:translation initiation factor 2 alpha subunit (eIF-2alpha)
MITPFQFYTNDKPVVGEEVLIKIISKNNDIIQAKLLEYNLDGLLIIKERNRKAFKKLKPLIILNKEVIVEISEIDGENITLYLNSKISQDMSKFNHNKRVISIFETLSFKTKRDFYELWQQYIYPIMLQDSTCNIYLSLLELSRTNQLIDELDEIVTKTKQVDNKSIIKFQIINPNQNGIIFIKEKLLELISKYQNIDIKLIKTPDYKVELIDYDENLINKFKDELALTFSQIIFKFL